MTLNTNFLPFFAHLPDFVTLIAVRVAVPSVWKLYTLPRFLAHGWQHVYLECPPPEKTSGNKHSSIYEVELIIHLRKFHILCLH